MLCALCGESFEILLWDEAQVKEWARISSGLSEDLLLGVPHRYGAIMPNKIRHVNPSLENLICVCVTRLMVGGSREEQED